MKVINIREIYAMLNWKNPSEIQLEGIRLAEKIDNLSLLIQPPAEASVWEQCANILYRKPDSVLEPYLIGLLEWLQDGNWPGAITVLDRLKSFSGKKLKQPFVDCVARAVELDNDEGTMWLFYLAELLDNKELKDGLPKEVIEILQKYSQFVE